MWLPPKVRHLVLINQTPLPSSFPPLLRFPPPPPSLSPPRPLSVLPIFGEKPVCSWDNPKLKTNSQLPSEPGERRHFLGFVLVEEEKGKNTHTHTHTHTHFWLLIVEECLSKLWSYQAQSVAKEGGRCMCFERGGREGFCWRRRRCGE